MADIVLQNIEDNSGMISALNNNFDKIEPKLNLALSKANDAVNQLNTPLDVNSQRLINLTAPLAGTDAARLIDVLTNSSGGATLPSVTGNAGKFLTTDGTIGIWDNPPTETVASITALTAKAKATLVDGQGSRTLGYYTSGDGGGGVLYWSAASTATVDGGTVFQADEGGTGRWLRIVENEVNARWWGAKGDNVTVDTAALQLAITYSCVNKKALFIPKGDYLIDSTLSNPTDNNAYFHMFGEPGTIFHASAAWTVPSIMMQIYGPPSIVGGRMVMHDLEFNAHNVGVVSCLRFGDTASAIVFVTATNIIARNSSGTGFEVNNVQVSSFNDCEAYNCQFGWVLENDPVNGGMTNNRFDSVRAWTCHVGFFINTTIPNVPLSGSVFINPLAQNCGLCAFAIFGTGGIIFRMDFKGLHCEANGSTTSPGDTTLYRGRTIRRANIQAEGPVDINFSTSQFGTGSSQPIGFYLRTGARVTVYSSSFGGGNSAQCIDADSTSKLFLKGTTLMGGFGEAIADWTGFTFVKDITGAGGVWSGVPNLTTSRAITNLYNGANKFPDAPTVVAAAGPTISLDFDASQGQVSKAVFTATAGAVGTNSVSIAPMAGGASIGDTAFFSVLMMSPTDTTVTAYPLGMTGSTTVKLYAGRWTLVNMFFGFSSAAASFNFHVYPVGTDAPTVMFAKFRSHLVVSGGDTNPLMEAIRHGHYNNNRMSFYSSAIPTAGTWEVGARCINSDPAVGQPKGWSCTVAGTPGTWVSEGNL